MVAIRLATTIIPFAGSVFGAAISTRQDPQTSGIIWPISYIALGDSFSAGIGAGKYTQDNPLVKKCKRMTGSYPTQVKGLFPHIDDKNFLFESCSGDKLENLDSQLSNLGGTRAQVVTLSISGNDFKFSTVVEKCVYNVLPLGKSDATADKECDTALDDAAKLIADETIWTTYKDKVGDILKTVMFPDLTGIPIPWSVLVITGYPKFWGDVKKDDDLCSKTRLKIPKAILSTIPLNGNYLRPGVRREMNKLVVSVNDRIQAEILPINPNKIEFVNIDPLYDGHRLCEDGATDPVGANSDSVWFTTFETKLQEDSFVPDPNSALEAQWSTMTLGLQPGNDFAPNELKINSNFHPKTGGHTMSARAVHDRVVDWGNRHQHTPTPPPQQCYPADAPNLPAKIFVGANTKLDPNQLLYKLRETLCANKCEIPAGIDTQAGAVVQDAGGRCEISLGLQGGSEAYAIRDRSISGNEQTQLCWDNLQSLINTCINNQPNYGWQAGIDPNPALYQTGFRRLNSPDAKHSTIDPNHVLQKDLSDFKTICGKDDGWCQENGCSGANFMCTDGKYKGCGCGKDTRWNQLERLEQNMQCKSSCCSTGPDHWYKQAWCDAHCGGISTQFC